MIVDRPDGKPLSVEEAQEVSGYVLPDLPAGVSWVKPGVLSQHVYFGHDEQLR